MDWSYFLTNAWFENAAKNYSFLIASVIAILKAVAIMNPGTQSNKIIDLLKGLLFKK